MRTVCRMPRASPIRENGDNHWRCIAGRLLLVVGWLFCWFLVLGWWFATCFFTCDRRSLTGFYTPYFQTFTFDVTLPFMWHAITKIFQLGTFPAWRSRLCARSVSQGRTENIFVACRSQIELLGRCGAGHSRRVQPGWKCSTRGEPFSDWDRDMFIYLCRERGKSERECVCGN